MSVATVSNAYNRPEKLSPALRERVLAVAADLGYAGPDPAAAALRRGRAGVVGVVFPETLGYAFSDPGAVAFLRGLASVFERAGLGVLLVPAAHGAGDPTPARSAAVDGFVVFSLPDGDRVLEAVLARRLPVVAQGGPRRPELAFVGIDDRAAASAAAQHVIALGHRRIAVAAFRPADPHTEGATYRVPRERLAGYRDAATAAGVSLAVEVQRLNSRACGATAARALFAAPKPPTAILAMSDELALGVLTAATEQGLRVPDDLSVIGFDDAGAAEAARLTTIAQDLEAQGEQAGTLLLSAADWAGEPPEKMFATHLVVRDTTGPPRVP